MKDLQLWLVLYTIIGAGCDFEIIDFEGLLKACWINIKETRIFLKSACRFFFKAE